MHITFLFRHFLALIGMVVVVTLGLIGCAQTNPQWTAPAGQIEKLPVLKVTPVVTSYNAPTPSSGSAPTPGMLYDVAFDFHGQSYLSRLPFDPGAWVLVTRLQAPLDPSMKALTAQNPETNTAPNATTNAATNAATTTPLTSSLPAPSPITTNLHSLSGPVFGSAPAFPEPVTLYVLPPDINLNVYPLVYNAFYTAGPSFFYGGGYYRYHSYGGWHGRGGRGGHGRR